MKQLALVPFLLVAMLTATAPAQSAEKLYGPYVGDFVADQVDDQKDPMYLNKINVSIDSIQGHKIQGHSVVAGNDRPFSGTIVKKGGSYAIQAKEPGDDPYDGLFQFTLDPKSKTIQGSWVANDKKLAVTRRRYQLNKTAFRYDPKLGLTNRMIDGRSGMNRVYNTENQKTGQAEYLTADVVKYNASSTPLSSRDVENMYKRDLEVIRNAIYARHGYSFQNRDMRYFFDRVPWYIPMSTNVTAQLTDLERRNIDILKRYENHAATYYDRFGR